MSHSPPAAARDVRAGDRFAFRPWVRGSVRRAMVWGAVALAALALVAWALRDPREEIYGRAFGVLGLYVALFLGALAKIWWTAGAQAAWFEDGRLLFQPLHLWRPRVIDLGGVHACNPRPGTHSLRFVVETPRGVREVFLNLAILDGRTRLLARLGEELVARGLEPVPGRHDSWRRRDWEEPLLSS